MSEPAARRARPGVHRSHVPADEGAGAPHDVSSSEKAPADPGACGWRLWANELCVL